MLFTSLGLVRIGKNCALRLESSPFSHGLSKKERLPNNALCLRHSYLPTLWTRRKFTLFPLFFGVFRFCFCFFFLGGGGGGGGGGVKRKRKVDLIRLALFFPKVIFYIIPYVRAFLLIHCFFNWVFYIFARCSVNHKKIDMRHSVGV